MPVRWPPRQCYNLRWTGCRRWAVQRKRSGGQGLAVQPVEERDKRIDHLRKAWRAAPESLGLHCRAAGGYLAALAAVAIISVLLHFVQSYVTIDNISMLYLIGVLGVAIAFGRGPAITVAVVAFLTFDWFFVEPLYTLRVAGPSEWLVLLLLLATAAITGQLAAELRHRAIEASKRQREASLLYDVVRLMNNSDVELALRDVAELLLRVLRLSAIRIRVETGGVPPLDSSAGDVDVLTRIGSEPSLAAQILGEGRERGDAGGRRAVHWVRLIPSVSSSFHRRAAPGQLSIVPIKLGQKRLGEMILAQSQRHPRFAEEDERLLSLVAAQLASAVERERLRLEATEAEALRRSEELKTALLNSVSHDLRTPISSIIAAAGALRQRGVWWTDKDREEFAADIEQEAQRLNRIVGNLLDLSRIEGGNLRPDKRLHDIGALVHDVAGRLKPFTAQHDVTVTVESDLPPVLLDYVEIDQALTNLIENAVRHTPAGTEITVSCRRDGSNLLVEVADQGPGIASKDLPHLFEPFYRGRRHPWRPHGSGLGLAVAKGLVEAHGGRLWAENRPGGGARFAFTLPLEPDAASERPLVEQLT